MDVHRMRRHPQVEERPLLVRALADREPETVVEGPRGPAVRAHGAVLAPHLDHAVRRHRHPGGVLDLRHLPDLRVAAAPERAGRGQYDEPVPVLHLAVLVPPEGTGQHLGQFETVPAPRLPYPELHHLRERDVCRRVRHSGCELALVHQADPAARQRREVDQQVHPLGRAGPQCRQHLVEIDRHRTRQQTAVAADLPDDARDRVVLVVDQHQIVDPGVGGVDEPEAVPGVIHVQIRPDTAVDRGVRTQERQRDRLSRLRVGLDDLGRLVQQPAVEPAVLVGVQIAVREDQRQLPVARRQPERVLLVVPDQIGADETGVHVPPGDVHGVVVVPPLGRLMVVRILRQLRVAEADRVVRPAVVPAARLRAVQMGHRPGGQRRDIRVRLDAVPSGPVVRRRLTRLHRAHLHGGDRVRAPLGDAVGPGDPDPLPAPHLDRGTGHRAVVAPHRGRRQLCVQPHPGRGERDLRLREHVPAVRAQHRRYGQRVRVGDESADPRPDVLVFPADLLRVYGSLGQGTSPVFRQLSEPGPLPPQVSAPGSLCT
ncbi:hypothetical protein EES39_35755 [Streptomyces sp. ADI92-24]|nr:hypothetical protein EES39_35755 [Streptomyces sp. ADI92-24]